MDRINNMKNIFQKILASMMIIFNILVIILVVYKFYTHINKAEPVCIEYIDQYQWISQFGSTYSAGNTLEEAVILAKDRPIKKYSKCTKYE